MRILVTGASGFIGGALADALARAGHQVVRASRHASGPDSLSVDLSRVPDAQWWSSRLAGVDAVVNAVGILREQGAQTFSALHARAPMELFKACAAAGVRCVVQVSALGADDHAASRYHLSKREADDFLRSLPLRAAIVQPSLVYGHGGSSAGLFNMLAAAPLLMLPRGGDIPLQPVHVDDVVAGVVAVLEHPPASTATTAFVGPSKMSMREYLRRLRAALGVRGQLRVLPLPEVLFRGLAAVAGRLPGSFLDADTAGMLLRGNAGDAGPFTQVLGRPPRPVERFVDAEHAPAAAMQAAMQLWLPVLRVSIALLWIWTGLVSFGLYPVSDSLALLARVGLNGSLAEVALYGAAGLDLLFGVLTLALPAARRGPLWVAQLLLIGGYTALITAFLPEYWLHPYGPITKNLPVLAAIALLWAADTITVRRPGSGPLADGQER